MARATTSGLTSVADGLAVPALVVDADGTIVAVNAAMAGAFGRPAEALLGRALGHCVADGAALAEFLSSDAAAPCECRISGDAGSVRVVALSVAARDRRGVLLTGFDLTSLRADEAMLREARDRYLDMATAGSDTLHEVEVRENEARGAVRIISVRRDADKPSFRESVLTWPDDVVDMSFDPEGMERYLATVRAGKPYQDVIWRMRRDDGREVYVRTSAVPYRTPDGELRGYRGIGVNVTRQVLAERALKESREKLAQARDAAEQASQSKSAFLANMSHELRTPLNAIIGFSEMIGGGFFGAISERYKSYAADIHASGHLLLELINQILDLSKVEAGRMELQESEFAADEIVAGCHRLLRDRAEKAGVTLSKEIAPGLPRLRADELKFKQILFNLVSNAIKFTPAGGCVRMAIEAGAEGLAVTVADTGVGMRAEDIPLALEPFRQVGDDKRRKQQGTGLGLPLAKAFAELHGGRFAIASAPQRGTTVTVVFPAERLEQAAELAVYGT